MELVGEKIKSVRIGKALSQEELGEIASVSTRTIQRIENGKVQPRGNTLKLISEALGIRLEELEISQMEKSETSLVLFYVSALSFLVIPAGNLILPIIIWFTQKNKSRHFDQMGKNLLNFQISWSITIVICMVMVAFFKIQHVYTSVADVLIKVIFGLIVFNILATIFSAIRISLKKSKFFYPKTISWLK